MSLHDPHAINVAIVGVGNCASSLVQGVAHYQNGGANEQIGLMHWDLGGYRPKDIRFVAAWDIDRRKVGTDVAEAIFGVKPAASGTIEINGKPVRIDSPNTAIRHGMAFLTEDRKETGCLLILDVLENMQIAVLQERFVNAGFDAESSVNAACPDMKQKLAVKTPTLQERVENLSGGNQQKVLIARWLLTNPKILILDEPTRGIDVGAKAEIHKLITNLAKARRLAPER